MSSASVCKELDLRVLQLLNNAHVDNSALKLTWGMFIYHTVTAADEMSLAESMASYSSRTDMKQNLKGLAQQRK